MDPELRSFVEIYRRFLDEVVSSASREAVVTPLGQIAQDFLGTDISALPVIAEIVSVHRLVDADLALEHLSEAGGGSVIGISHGQARHHEELPGLLGHPYVPYAPAPVDFVSVPTGPDTERQVVSLGLRMFRFRDQPAIVLQRAAQPQFGQLHAKLEVLTADQGVAAALIRELRSLMVRLSVLRGKVLTLTESDLGQGAAGATFVARPEVAADDIVLAEGTLDAITRHVVGIGKHRDRLLEAGQHLKRGVLLHGPPGTGKTLTVRHLIARTPGTTVVLLTGPSIRFITEAAEIARAMQPAIVVLEDVDLVARDRTMHSGSQPLLFAVLDALDGLDGDADVTFLLTTNRVELLERALAERPGRVDLAMEIPLPDEESRRRLFVLYTKGLPLSAEAVDAAAAAADGVTGSFAKELTRRAVLAAAEEGREVVDEDLATALRDLLSAREALTRTLLGASAAGGPEGEDGAATFGWTAHRPLSGSSSAMSSTLTIEPDDMEESRPTI